ncbi:helix-turn-helix transcriptional regulator [Streptomyces cyaneofuscatus]|uniref:helix-turn-helix domain-containing protein n=1 Tax=Streptomyces cyaneofuscatus TaxID=66883 RepID=UPI002FF3BA71
MEPTRHPLGDTTRHVGRIVRDLRERQGISTTAMAQRLTALGRRISQSGVTRLETGQRRIDVDDLAALAAVLGVHPAALLPAAPTPEGPADACALHGHSYDSHEISGPGPRVCNDCGHTEETTED